MTDKKSEEQILFPEQEIAGILVKPWTFGDLFSIGEPLERVLDKVESIGIADKIIDPESGNLKLDYFSFARLFTIASQELLAVIQATLKVEEEVIKDLSIQDGLEIVFLMFQQNKEMIVNALKNVSSPPPSKLQEKIRARGQKKKTKA